MSATTPEVFDVTPGLRLLRAITALDDAEIERVQTETDPTELVQSVASIALAWGYKTHGEHLAAMLDAHLLDQSLDPIAPPRPTH